MGPGGMREVREDGREGGRECENLGRLLDWNGLFKDGRYGSLRGKEGERGGDRCGEQTVTDGRRWRWQRKWKRKWKRKRAVE
jgi:hypothetical protein